MKTTDKTMIKIIIMTLIFVIAAIFPALLVKNFMSTNDLHNMGIALIVVNIILSILWALSGLEGIKIKLVTNYIIMLFTLFFTLAIGALGWYLFRNY